MRYVLLIMMYSLLARSELSLTVSEGNVLPISVALVPFTSADSGLCPLADNIARVAKENLESTGLFQFISEKSLIQQDLNISILPRFSDWRLLKSQVLIYGTVEIQGEMIKVRYRVWDVFMEKILITETLESTTTFWRRLSHLISDAIYTKLSGEKGYFDTRIVYIAEQTVPDKKRVHRREKRLAIMDQDGENHKYLTDGQHIVLTPRFSPTTQKIAYLSYEASIPKVYVLDLETGAQELVGKFPGMTFAPRFSPDGRKIIMSQALSGKSDIYTMDLDTRLVKRLTHGSSIDTSPCYSPDGEKITLNSDRGGSKQIYIMDSDGRNPKRISFGGGVYSTPVWSPRGDWIAFTKTQDGEFYIGVMRPNGSGERLIATGFIVEGPTWTPNGRIIAFTRQQKAKPGMHGVSKNYAIDLTGDNEHVIQTPGEGSDPAWSPLLPTA